MAAIAIYQATQLAIIQTQQVEDMVFSYILKHITEGCYSANTASMLSAVGRALVPASAPANNTEVYSVHSVVN